MKNDQKHHCLLRAIWEIDRFNPNVEEKLKELKSLLSKHDPDILCNLYHEVTGAVLAKASPLLIACFEGDPDVIKLLIMSGVDVNQTESEHFLSALHVICDAEFNGQSLSQKDRGDIVRLLVQHNANVNHLDRSSMTALHKAVIHDRSYCCQGLMEAKADPNVIYMGDTPLSIAARHNREKICRILLRYRETNVNYRNNQGGTPLHYACAALKDSPNCVEVLVYCGAKINVQDHKKNTPIMVASFFNKPKITQFLLDAGADLKIKNNEDKDAFDVANEKNHFEAKSILVRQFEKIGLVRKSMKNFESLDIKFESNDHIFSI